MLASPSRSSLVLFPIYWELKEATTAVWNWGGDVRSWCFLNTCSCFSLTLTSTFRGSWLHQFLGLSGWFCGTKMGGFLSFPTTDWPLIQVSWVCQVFIPTHLLLIFKVIVCFFFIHSFCPCEHAPFHFCFMEVIPLFSPPYLTASLAKGSWASLLDMLNPSVLIHKTVTSHHLQVVRIRA